MYSTYLTLGAAAGTVNVVNALPKILMLLTVKEKLFDTVFVKQPEPDPPTQSDILMQTGSSLIVLKGTKISDVPDIEMAV